METITITISAATLNTVGLALQELPFKHAAPAIKEIEAQVNQYLMERKNNESRNTDPADSHSGGTGEKDNRP